MDSRVDFERYPNAAKLCRNFVLFPQGGASRRPGTRFVKEVKDSSVFTRLIPFEYSEDDSYQIEAGNNYFRFYRRQGNITVGQTDASVTNGLFTSNITGWTDASTGSGASITHDATNGRLQLTGASGAVAWARQAITITAGFTSVEHVLKFRIAGVGGDGGKVGFQVGTTTTGSEILTEVMLGAGEHSIGFTPGATTFYIQFRNTNTPPRNMYIDNVSFISDAPMELVSPYETDDLSNLAYFQAADIVYITNSDFLTRKIERRGHHSWSIVEVFFDDGPWLGINDSTNLNLSQLVDNGLFENGLTNFTDESTGDAFVVYNEAGKFAELDAGTGGSGVSIMRTTATVVNSKKLVLHILILAAGPVTVKFGTSAGGSQYSSNAQMPGWVSYELTTTSTTLHFEFSHDESVAGRAGVSGVLVYSQDARLLEPSAQTGTVTVTALGFTPFASNDVGRLLRLEWPGFEPGFGVITAYTSSTVVSLFVLRKLPSTTPTESWRFGAFGGSQGYPKVIAFYDGRLAIANTPARTNSIWLSQSGQLENMRPDSFEEGALTAQADDAIAVTLRSTKINPIYWMKGTKKLMVGTAGGEWVVQSSGAVVTPSDISAKEHAAVPCADIQAVEINQTILFADRAHKQVHDLGFSLQEDTFLATDLTILSDHVFRSQIQEMAYQRSPHSIIWCRKANGALASLSYNKQHQVLGWSQSVIGGTFDDGDAVVESISVNPGSDDNSQIFHSNERNEIWLIVKRTIDGDTKRYIEFIEYFFDGPLREDYDTEALWRTAIAEAQADAFYVDSGLTYDGVATTTITGLDHLEGEVVKILADGKVHPTKTVASGEITLDYSASVVHIGLAYKHKYESLKLSANTGEGTGVNKIKIISSVGLIVLDSSGFSVTAVDYDMNGRRPHLPLYPQSFEDDGHDPADAVPLFTGELKPSVPGAWSRDARVYLEGDNPLPFTLLGLAPQMEIRSR